MEGGDVGLKEQFQQLQEQQQLKLLERRKKKEDKKNEKKGKEEKGGSSGTFKVNDDLDLKLADHSNKGYGYVSEELVDHLNDQIRQLKDENGRVYKLLSEKDFEIRQYKKKTEEQASNRIDLSVTSETAATKIVELSKKVRELTAEKESEKTRCKQFQKKCHDLQLQLQSQPPTQDNTPNSSVMGSMVSLRSVRSAATGVSQSHAMSDQNREDDGIDVKALQDRLKQSESRLSDFRNQCQQLRQELKVAHKVLSQEIGETVNIQSLLNETSQWRGRAQQIIGLQQKIEEMKVKYEGPPPGMEQLGGGDKMMTARRRQEDRYREELKRAEKERKEALETSMNKLKGLEDDHEKVKNKLDASKTRNKVLSNELKGLKAQVQTLLRKSQNDDEFIEALMKQQKQLKDMMETTSSKQNAQQQQQQHQLLQMNMKSQQDNNIVEQLKMIAAQKESQVKMLEMELAQLRNAHASSHFKPPQAWADQSTTETVTSGSVMSGTITPGPPLDGTASATPGGAVGVTYRREASQMSSARSSARSMSRMSNQPTPTPGEPRALTPSTASQKEVENLRYQLQELTVLSKAVEVERDKMTELVQVLQTRLTEEIDRHHKTQQELQSQKRSGIELEKMLGRKNMEVIKARGGVDSKVQDGGHIDGGEDSDDEEMGGSSTKAELVTRLEIQKDEIQSLKLALQRSLKAKDEDLKVYSKTLDETKQVFLQALRQMKDRQT